MIKVINGTKFNIDFCKEFSAQKLKEIYNGESEETINLLIAEIYPTLEEPKAKKITK